MDGELRRAATIVRHVRDIITIVDADGRVVYVNDAPLEMLGTSPADAEGTLAVSYVHPDDQDYVLENRRTLLQESGSTTTTVMRVRAQGGQWRHVETHGVNLLDDPDVRGLLYVTRDVEDRAQAEAALLRALAAQRIVSELGLRALQSDDHEGLLHEALARVGAALGAVEVTLTQPGGSDLRHLRPCASTAAGTRGGPVAEVDLHGPDGSLGVLAARTRHPCSAADEQFLQGVANVLAGAVLRDGRHRAALSEALHDDLTGLATRPLLAYRLQQALRRSDRENQPVALLMVDLDHFKQVNDEHGHAAGDEVLRQLGPRLVASVRAADTVARYGGDEFVVLCDELVHKDSVTQVASRIRAACGRPFTLADGTQVRLDGSVGVAWSTEVGTEAAALLHAADEAMYRDKRNG